MLGCPVHRHLVDGCTGCSERAFRAAEVTRRARVTFRAPVAVEIERTTIGTAVGWRLSPGARAAVRAQLEAGPFLEAFDAVGNVRDIAGDLDRAHLMACDDELQAVLDRDRSLCRRAV